MDPEAFGQGGSDRDAEMRRRAEALVQRQIAVEEPASALEAAALLHELRVHQIELEMQNDELRRTQEVLETSRASYIDLYDHAAVGYLSLDREGTIVDANLPAAALLEVDREHIAGRALTSIVFRDDQDEYYLHRRRLAADGGRHVCDLRLVLPGGAHRWVRLEERVIEAGGGDAYSRAAISDISAQRETEEANACLAAIVACSEDAILSKTLDGTIVSWNRSAERLYGYTAEEAIGQYISLLAPDGADDQIDDLLSLIRRGAAVERLEAVRVRKDGVHVDVSLSISPIKNGAGIVIGASTIAHDITDQTRAAAEIRRLNAELEGRVLARTAQLEASNRELEAFVYSASHDLRAPLRAIDGFSEMVIEDAGEKLDADDLEHLRRVRAAAQRMALLMDELLALSRASRGGLLVESVDVSAVAAAVVGELREREPERHVETVVAPGMRAEADVVLLRAILANLLGNAWKFTSQHETARIEVGVTDADGERAFFVRDDGAGFDEQYATHLFGAFQRMHPAGGFEGDGIGLATVQRLVTRHGGRVWAEAQVEQGATFFFTLSKPDGSA